MVRTVYHKNQRIRAIYQGKKIDGKKVYLCYINNKDIGDDYKTLSEAINDAIKQIDEII